MAERSRLLLIDSLQADGVDPLAARANSSIELTTDGDLLVRQGMTAQGYVDPQGHPIATRDMVGLDPQGEPVERVDSTLGVAQALEGPVDPREVLDLRLASVYMLDPVDLPDALRDSLQGGDVYRFAFAYRSGFKQDTAFLVANDAGFFALIGQSTVTPWSELAQVPIDTFEDDDDDDLDFDMF